MTVIAHHLVWTVYGTWLGNDPRGSGSRSVYTPALAALGDVHHGRRQVQPPRRMVRDFYQEATPRLQYPVMQTELYQFDFIAKLFADTIKKHNYTCYACAIMPDHVHLVIRKHRDVGETMIEHFQCESRLRFSLEFALPEGHPLWTKNGWNRFLGSPGAVRGRIRYVEGNPEKEGLPRQRWPFVVAYDGWPFHKKLNRKR
jgi:REP element-mobilizing transposase RayT